jgi:opacity protein-like surface antigen
MSKMILLSAAGLSMFAAINAEEAATADSQIAVVNTEEVAVAEGEIAADCTTPKKPTPPPCKPKPAPVCKPKPKPKPKCEPQPKCQLKCEPVKQGHVYTSFRSGVNFLHAGEENDIELQPKVGYSLAGAVGYRWQNNLAVEGEFVYRYNGVTTVEFLEHKTNACGKVFSYNGYVNGYYYLPWSFGLPNVTPYFGGGIGYGHQTANACPYEFHNNGKKGGFVWQVMGGFAQKLFDHFEIGVEYRFSAGPQSLGFLYHQTANFTFTYLF